MEVLEDLLIDNLKIYQDTDLYRFTSDSIILSRFASFRKNEVVGDFCSGCGIVGIHYYAIHKNLKQVDLIEIQKPLFELANKTIEYNKIGEKVFSYNLAIQDLDSSFNDKYSLILCNPPYKKEKSGDKNENDHIAICRHEIKVTLEEIIKVAYKKLKFGGRICICQRIERFVDIIIMMKENRIEPNRIQFVSNKKDGAPYLCLIEGTKGLKPQLEVLATKINED